MLRHWIDRQKPPEWSDIAAAVLCDTDNRCESCKVQHLAQVFRSPDGQITNPDDSQLIGANPGQWTTAIVQVIPLDGNYRHTHPDNLIALCLVCQDRRRRGQRLKHLRAIQTTLDLPQGTAGTKARRHEDKPTPVF